MNSKSNLTTEEQKKYEKFFSSLNETFDENLKKEEQKRKDAEIREKAHKEMQRQKYLESLKPISRYEFMQEMKLLFERYKKHLEYKRDENILFCSMDLDLKKIIKQVQVAENGLELAEILDNAKKTMSDLEGIKNIVDDTNKIIEEELEKRKHPQNTTGILLSELKKQR